METTVQLYKSDTKYFSEAGVYGARSIKSTRKVAISWKKNINLIIELSHVPKTTHINLQTSLIKPRKKKHRSPISQESTLSEVEQKLNIVQTSTQNNAQDSIGEQPVDGRHQYRLRAPLVNTHVYTQPNAMNMDEFWAIIQSLQWRDMDEGRMTKQVLSRITPGKKISIRYIINNTLIPELKMALADIPLLESIVESDHNNILTHIIFKGKDFYNGVISEPLISLWLCTQFYPAHTWLSY